MSKPTTKKTPTPETVKQPKQGGSYVKNKETGDLDLISQTKPAATSAQAKGE